MSSAESPPLDDPAAEPFKGASAENEEAMPVDEPCAVTLGREVSCARLRAAAEQAERAAETTSPTP